jgi:hypothetical protein
MNEITWTLTPQQVEQIAALLDLACKAGGIEAAKVAVPLMDSLMAAVKKQEPEKE